MAVASTETYYVLGAMSGTSLDGLDLAFAKFSKTGEWRYEMIRAKTLPYPRFWQKRLSHAIHLSQGDLESLDKKYTQYLASAIQNFIIENEIPVLDAVCSHGHTVLHQPERGITVQIGNRPELAQLTGQRVICDFRVQDVKLGGQGAPLVPIGDKLLFGGYDACINLGGFANISFDNDGKRMAYDICPVNVVLNHFAQQLGLDYDKDGEMAAAHKVHSILRQELNRLPYYRSQPPKSLGMEWVNENIFPLMAGRKIAPERKLSTFTEHISEQIAKVLNQQKNLKNGKVLMTGGGAYNAHLLKCIMYKTHAELVVPDKDLIEYKEALIFGLLGVLRLRNTNNVLKSVTGASRDHCAGTIYIP